MITNTQSTTENTNNSTMLAVPIHMSMYNLQPSSVWQRCPKHALKKIAFSANGVEEIRLGSMILHKN